MEWMYLTQICIPLCCCLVAKLCPSVCDPMDCRPPGSSVHGISQARILEWVTMSFSRGSSWPRDGTHVFCIGRQILYCWATKEALYSSRKDENTNFKKNTKKKKANPYLINPPNKPVRRSLVLACGTDEECRAWWAQVTQLYLPDSGLLESS